MFSKESKLCHYFYASDKGSIKIWSTLMLTSLYYLWIFCKLPTNIVPRTNLILNYNFFKFIFYHMYLSTIRKLEAWYEPYHYCTINSYNIFFLERFKFKVQTAQSFAQKSNNSTNTVFRNCIWQNICKKRCNSCKVCLVLKFPANPTFSCCSLLDSTKWPCIKPMTFWESNAKVM